MSPQNPDAWAGLARVIQRLFHPDQKRDVSVRCARWRTAHGAIMELASARRALAALDKPATDAVVAGRKRISKRVNAAIDLLVSGECRKINEAAKKVGLARESLSRALSTPHIAAHLRMKVARSLAI